MHDKKRKSSFDNISGEFDLDGHHTLVEETDLNAIDKKAKEKSGFW